MLSSLLLLYPAINSFDTAKISSFEPVRAKEASTAVAKEVVDAVEGLTVVRARSADSLGTSARGAASSSSNLLLDLLEIAINSFNSSSSWASPPRPPKALAIIQAVSIVVLVLVGASLLGGAKAEYLVVPL